MLYGLDFIHLWLRGAKPTPKNTKSYYFSPCHSNLNSLPAHDFSKLLLIEAYNTHYNFDMIRLSETYLDFSYADDDTRLYLKDFTLIRADNLRNCKGGSELLFMLRTFDRSPRKSSKFK